MCVHKVGEVIVWTVIFTVSPVRWFYLSSPSVSLKHILLSLPQQTSLMFCKVWLWETAGFPRICSVVRVTSYCTAKNGVYEWQMAVPGVKALPHSAHTSEQWSQCCWWWWQGWLGRGLPCWWNLAFPYSSCCQSYVGNISECSKSSSGRPHASTKVQRRVLWITLIKLKWPDLATLVYKLTGLPYGWLAALFLIGTK